MVLVRRPRLARIVRAPRMWAAHYQLLRNAPVSRLRRALVALRLTIAGL